MSEKSVRRPEPVTVAIVWDDLWLGAIYLSNPGIAGSPRKVYGDRGPLRPVGCRALDGLERVTDSTQSNSEY